MNDQELQKWAHRAIDFAHRLSPEYAKGFGHEASRTLSFLAYLFLKEKLKNLSNLTIQIFIFNKIHDGTVPSDGQSIPGLKNNYFIVLSLNDVAIACYPLKCLVMQATEFLVYLNQQDFGEKIKRLFLEKIWFYLNASFFSNGTSRHLLISYLLKLYNATMPSVMTIDAQMELCIKLQAYFKKFHTSLEEINTSLQKAESLNSSIKEFVEMEEDRVRNSKPSVKVPLLSLQQKIPFLYLQKERSVKLNLSLFLSKFTKHP